MCIHTYAYIYVYIYNYICDMYLYNIYKCMCIIVYIYIYTVYEYGITAAFLRTWQPELARPDKGRGAEPHQSSPKAAALSVWRMEFLA